MSGGTWQVVMCGSSDEHRIVWVEKLYPYFLRGRAVTLGLAIRYSGVCFLSSLVLALPSYFSPLRHHPRPFQKKTSSFAPEFPQKEMSLLILVPKGSLLFSSQL